MSEKIVSNSMKNSKMFQIKEISRRIRCLCKGGTTKVVFAIFGTCLAPGFCLAQEALHDVQGVGVLTRGPRHEAFAGIVMYDSVPGIIVQQAPLGVPHTTFGRAGGHSYVDGYWDYSIVRRGTLFAPRLF